jgi:DNA ligase D-like protein (predicted 3'-phosphoesterase)
MGNAKRDRDDLDGSPEPAGGAASAAARFVIQEHDASSHHFDLRLEAEGVLKSWAVPKGPSTDPQEKRLAVRTEDHSIDYADFEGTIPEDEYGGGRVIVWDAGIYDNLTEDDDGERVPVARGVEGGYVKFRLHGEKLSGGYVLTRTRFRGEEDNWLLIKVADEGADARRRPVSTERESVLSGRTVDEVEDPPDGGEDAP